MSRYIYSTLIAVALLLYSIVPGTAAAHYSLITILHTNDMHATVLPSDDSGGLARVATVVEHVRKDMPNVLLLDGGDIIHGSPEDYYSRGKAIISCMNDLGYDAAATGNHEYDFGLDTLKAVMATANFPFLAANVHAASGGQWDRVEPYRIFTVDGIRIGIIGLTTLETISLHWPDNIKDIVVEDPFDTAVKYVPEVRKMADVVVVLSHLGDDQDEILAEKVKGIDFIVGGHTHVSILQHRQVGNAIIAQAGANARAVGRIDFIVRVDDNGARILSVNGPEDNWNDLSRPPLGKKYPTTALLPVDNSIIPDKAVVATYMPYRDAVNSRMAEVVAKAMQPLPGSKNGNSESPAADMVADAVKALAKSDIAIIDAGSVNEKGLNEGPLTAGDAYNLIGGITRQEIVICSVTGKDIQSALNANIQKHHTLTRASSGLSVAYNTAGEVDLSIDGKPIDLNQSYSVAAQAYVMMEIMKTATSEIKILAEPKATTREAILNYFKMQKTIAPPALGRVKEMVTAAQ